MALQPSNGFFCHYDIINPEVEMRSKTSIVIICKNQKKYLKRSLPIIFDQIFSNFEVIVVDSGSKDGSIKFVKKYPTKLVEIKPEKFNYAYAFNQGANLAKGDYLVRLSGDAVPKDELWLGNLVKNFKNDRVAGVYSRWINPPDANLIDQYVAWMSMRDKKLIFTKAPNWNGASGALRKSLWQKYPFDESLAFCEDWDWSRKVQKQGFKIVYEPNSQVYHSHKENILLSSKRGLKIIAALMKIYSKKV